MSSLFVFVCFLSLTCSILGSDSSHQSSLVFVGLFVVSHFSLKQKRARRVEITRYCSFAVVVLVFLFYIVFLSLYCYTFCFSDSLCTARSGRARRELLASLKLKQLQRPRFKLQANHKVMFSSCHLPSNTLTAGPVITIPSLVSLMHTSPPSKHTVSSAPTIPCPRRAAKIAQAPLKTTTLREKEQETSDNNHLPQAIVIPTDLSHTRATQRVSPSSCTISTFVSHSASTALPSAFHILLFRATSKQ